MRNVQKILNAILSKNIFEYLLVDREYRLKQFSEEITPFLDTEEETLTLESSLFDLLPELVGSEERMQEVLEGKRDSYAITIIAKNDRYFNIYIDHFDDETLLILLQDITEVTRIRQEALQYSNQTTLLTETLKKIINSQNSMIFLANTLNRIEFANEKFLDYFKVDPRNLGTKDLEIYRRISSGFSSYSDMHHAVIRGQKEFRIGEDVFTVESIHIDPANILFTFSKITELYRTKEQLREELNYDPLTRVYRKQVFDERVEKLLQSDEPFAVVVVDIDNFKQINDRYGHIAGDSALCQFAEILRREIDKEKELVARWGGEEFLLLLRTSLPEEARKRAERLRRTTEKFRFDAIPRLTASFGLTWRGENDALESLLARADKALYRAKGEGKNRVVYIPSLDH